MELLLSVLGVLWSIFGTAAYVSIDEPARKWSWKQKALVTFLCGPMVWLAQSLKVFWYSVLGPLCYKIWKKLGEN